MCFSLSSAFHWLWHDRYDFCENTAHSCRNTRIGIIGDAWQIPVHLPISFDEHSFDCPLCSGLLSWSDLPADDIWSLWAEFTADSNSTGRRFIETDKRNLPIPRGPPVFS